MRVIATPTSGVIPSTPVAWATSNLLAIATGRILRTYTTDPSSSVRNPLSVLNGHTAVVTAVIPLPGMRIASASEDGTVRVWDVTTGQSLRIFDLGNPVLHIAYVAPEQLLCLTSGALFHVRLTRDRSKRRRRLVRKLLPDALSAPARLVVSADASIIAVSDATNIHLTALGAAEAITTLRCRRVITALAITRDGNILAAADESGVISLYYNPRDLLGSERLIIPFEKASPSQLHWHASAPQALTFAHNDSVILSAGSEAVLVTWRLGPALFGTRTFLPRLRSAILAISVSPDERMYALSQTDNTVRLIDQLSSGVVHTIQAVPTRLLEFSDQNPEAVSSSRVNPRHIETCSVAQDSKRPGKLWVAGAGPSLQLFDAFGGSVVEEIEVIPRNSVFQEPRNGNTAAGSTSAAVSGLALHSSGLFLATTDSQDMHTSHSRRYGTDTAVHTVKLWRRESADESFALEAVISQPHGSDCSVSSLCFHPKLPLLITTSTASRTFKLWRATRSGKGCRTAWRSEVELDYKGLDCSGVCFSSDGSVLFVACGHILTMWHFEDRLASGANDTDRLGESYRSEYCPETSPCSVSVEFLHALVHPPSEERIVSVAFMFRSVPLVVAVTRNGIYVWHALSQSIWWSTRIRSDTQKLAVDPDSGRFALQVVIPSVGNHEEDSERQHVERTHSGGDVDGKQSAVEGSTAGPVTTDSKDESDEQHVSISLLQNGLERRKVENDPQGRRVTGKSELQACTDAAVAVYDANAPVPLYIHRLATGANVAALSFVKQPGLTNRSLSTLVLMDSRMEVFLYGAVSSLTSHSLGEPADVSGTSKRQSVGNLERVLGKEVGGQDWSGAAKSSGHLTSQIQSIMGSTVGNAFRTFFHGQTHVQAPAALNSFEFVNSLLINHQRSRQHQQRTIPPPTNIPDCLETGIYDHENHENDLHESSRDPTVEVNKTEEHSGNPDCVAIRSFCVSVIRKGNKNLVPAR